MRVVVGSVIMLDGSSARQRFGEGVAMEKGDVCLAQAGDSTSYVVVRAADRETVAAILASRPGVVVLPDRPTIGLSPVCACGPSQRLHNGECLRCKRPPA